MLRAPPALRGSQSLCSSPLCSLLLHKIAVQAFAKGPGLMKSSSSSSSNILFIVRPLGPFVPPNRLGRSGGSGCSLSMPEALSADKPGASSGRLMAAFSTGSTLSSLTSSFAGAGNSRSLSFLGAAEAGKPPGPGASEGFSKGSDTAGGAPKRLVDFVDAAGFVGSGSHAASLSEPDEPEDIRCRRAAKRPAAVDFTDVSGAAFDTADTVGSTASAVKVWAVPDPSAIGAPGVTDSTG